MAVEMLKPKRFGRIRLRRIANDSGACVIPFMQGGRRAWRTGTNRWLGAARTLDAYLDGFVFCFNRRTSKSRGMFFYRLLQQAIVTAPVTYRGVVEKA